MNWDKKTVQISQIKEYEANPRNITEKGLEDLKKSIKKFGQAEPLVVNTNMTLIGGHARKLAMESLGFETCQIYIPTKKLTDKEVQELNIRLNRNIAGEFDWEALSLFDKEDLQDWGFEDFESMEFGDKNKEIDVSEFSDEMTLTLKFNEHDYNFVKSKLTSIADSPEQAILDLLNE